MAATNQQILVLEGPLPAVNISGRPGGANFNLDNINGVTPNRLFPMGPTILDPWIHNGDNCTITRSAGSYHCTCSGWRCSQYPHPRKSCRHLRKELGIAYETARQMEYLLDEQEYERWRSCKRKYLGEKMNPALQAVRGGGGAAVGVLINPVPGVSVPARRSRRLAGLQP